MNGWEAIQAMKRGAIVTGTMHLVFYAIDGCYFRSTTNPGLPVEKWGLVNADSNLFDPNMVFVVWKLPQDVPDPCAGKTVEIDGRKYTLTPVGGL